MNGLTWLINPPAQIPQPTGGRVVRMLSADDPDDEPEGSKIAAVVEALPPDVLAQLAELKRAKQALKVMRKRERSARQRRHARATQHDVIEAALRARSGMNIHELGIVTGFGPNLISVILAQLKTKGRARNEMKDAAGVAIYPAKWYAVDGVLA
jgi:hypothetical protein